jgi:hypothetical protein
MQHQFLLRVDTHQNAQVPPELQLCKRWVKAEALAQHTE